MDELIIVKQLPVIEERLRLLKEHWEQLSKDAESMVCTEETIQSVKAFRADMRKEFDEVEAQRKAAKNAIIAPYVKFEAVYNDCVTTAFRKADMSCADKISEVETEIKKRCEDGLRDYFAELCAVRHLDWLEYERAGVKVDMASAKAKTSTKLRKQLSDFVTRIGDSVDRILEMDDADEIMAEFKRCLDVGEAMCIVQERKRRIEDEREEMERRKAAREQESEAIHRVEALAPPVATSEPYDASKYSVVDGELVSKRYVSEDGQKIYRCDFTVHATIEQLKKLKEFLNMEGIQYE